MSSLSVSAPSSAPPPSTQVVSTPSQASSTPPPPASPSTTTGQSSTPQQPSTSNPPPTSTSSSQPAADTSSSSSSSSSSTITSRPSFTPLESPSTFLSVSNGNTIVVTTVIRSTPSSTGVVSSNNTSKGFFDNTGAVAGTFSVVGLVGLGILIFIITTVIRRRRAERFDQDVALAAAEAAATAHNPDFDDEYGYGSSGHGAGGYGYPDKFPPTREAYGMSDVGNNAYADTDNYTVGTGTGPGNAGIGAGALYRSKSGKNQPDPFHAYAAHHDPAMSQHQANLRYRNPGQDQWEGQNLAGGGYDVARNISQPHPDGGVVRNKSRSIRSDGPDPSLSSHYSTDPLTYDPQPHPPPPMPESYLDRYRAGVDPENHQVQARPLSTASMTDAYGGVTPGRPPPQQPPVPQQPGRAGGPPNPFESQTQGDLRPSVSSDYSDGPPPPFGQDESRMSLRDDEDYGAGRRVLKVANE